MAKYYQPVRVSFDGCGVRERAPFCNMTEERAKEYARGAWGDDGGIVLERDDGHASHEIVWVATEAR